MTVSEQIAEFAGSIRPASLPQGVKDSARNLLIDVAGLCLAARHSDYVKACVASAVRGGRSTAIGHDGSFGPYDAALINGTAAHGEDYHSFRALAERSQLADNIKDTAVVTQVPQLGPEWDRELKAQQGWSQFKLADFDRLHRDFGVGWVIVAYPQPAGLDCGWDDDRLAVCRIP